jgi:sulfopyruvate decarboxylase alpha subunit
MVQEEWAAQVIKALKEAHVSFLIYVPDNLLARILDRAAEDRAFRLISATREEEGVGIACGVTLGGERAALFMQSSGLGNCVNALASLAIPYQIPLPLLISLRGDAGEWNPVQIPMGRAAGGVLSTLGIPHLRLERAQDAGRLTTQVVDLALSTQMPVGLFLTKGLAEGDSSDRSV